MGYGLGICLQSPYLLPSAFVHKGLDHLPRHREQGGCIDHNHLLHHLCHNTASIIPTTRRSTIVRTRVVVRRQFSESFQILLRGSVQLLAAQPRQVQHVYRLINHAAAALRGSHEPDTGCTIYVYKRVYEHSVYDPSLCAHCRGGRGRCYEE